MTRTHRTLAAATLAALAITLAGCTPSGSGASPSPSDPAASGTPSATASATPTPSPTETFNPHPPVADLRLTTSGLLPLTLGEPPATNPGAEMIVFDAEYCLAPELDMTEGDLGRWVPNYSGSPFRVGASDAEVYRIDVIQPGIITAEGIGIGSTLADLQAAYPSLIAGSGGVVSHVWYIQDANGTVVFETQNADMDTSVPGAPGDPVILMRALSPAWGADVDWGAANSGNVADACF